MQKTTYINPTSPSFCMDRNLCEMFANHLGLNVEVENIYHLFRDSFNIHGSVCV